MEKHPLQKQNRVTQIQSGDILRIHFLSKQTEPSYPNRNQQKVS